MVSVVSVTPPDVVMCASAKRVFPLHLLAISTRVWSAVLSMSTRSASALAWSRVSNWDEAIIERAANPVRRLAADHVHRALEHRRVALIGDVAQHAHDLAVANLVEPLP